MKIRVAVAVFVSTAALAASAQQLYRWTDGTGRVHVTDTPPPASARNIQQKKAGAAGATEPRQPYELAQAVREFPVKLYTAPSCKEPCAAARALLNKRAIPFKEMQVWDEQSSDELKRVSGGGDVPTLVVGRSVHRGYAQEGYDALLDSARYPRTGLLAPPAPEGYNAVAEPPKPTPETPLPSGPYAPRPRN